MWSRVALAFKHLFSKENLWAILIAMALVAIVVLTSDSSPLWIYQGF